MNFLQKLSTFITSLTLVISFPIIGHATDGSGPTTLDMITSPVGIISILF